MRGKSKFAPVQVEVEDRDDGVRIVSNGLRLPDLGPFLPDLLAHWGQARPDQVFLSEPRGDERVTLTFREAAQAVATRAAHLLPLPISADRPVMIVGVNGLNHATVMLAAAAIGIPAAIVSPAYCSSGAAPWTKFATLLDGVEPGLVVADDAAVMRTVLETIGRSDLDVQSLVDLTWLDESEAATPDQVASARAAVGPDTVTKLLFTSGSTGSPKAVMNTPRMMVSNMQGVELVWPFLRERPPVLVDWLPWNHTFGGNCNFDLALYFGGTMHIDDGKPLPGLITRTVSAIRELEPTVYFSVPGGYEALLPHLESDLDFAREFLGNVDFLFNAGAPMPASVRARLEEIARAVVGEIPPIIGAWGATETAPFSTIIYFDTEHAGNLGVPLPGTEIKLVPNGGRSELRVRGPNVTPGYWRQPEATAAAFDDEGFYCIGDAGRFADPERPEAGLLFDGRVAENFKLSSGTWVNVGALRLAVIAATRHLVSDAVVTGEGRDELGVLLFMNEHACRVLLGESSCAALSRAEAVGHEAVESHISTLLAEYNAAQGGSSTRIARFAILPDAPSATHDEITDKGYINQRATLRRREKEIDAMYAGSPSLAGRRPSKAEAPRP